MRHLTFGVGAEASGEGRREPAGRQHPEGAGGSYKAAPRRRSSEGGFGKGWRWRRLRTEVCGDGGVRDGGSGSGGVW